MPKTIKRIITAPIVKTIQWPRADPVQLQKFDPDSKYCTMNCGQHHDDPRSKEECKFLCKDC